MKVYVAVRTRSGLVDVIKVTFDKAEHMATMSQFRTEYDEADDDIDEQCEDFWVCDRCGKPTFDPHHPAGMTLCDECYHKGWWSCEIDGHDILKGNSCPLCGATEPPKRCVDVSGEVNFDVCKEHGEVIKPFHFGAVGERIQRILKCTVCGRMWYECYKSTEDIDADTNETLMDYS